MYRKSIFVISLLLVIVACSKEVVEAFFAGFQKPATFPDPVYRFADNQITKEKFELGRKLFYDVRLSRNNTISCGSCHIQSGAFTQPNHDVSHGIDDRLGTRNAPPIMNLAWMPSFMWDGGVFDLDLQPLVPITAHEEMNENITNVLSKLRGQSTYISLFQKAYGDTSITSVRMLKSLSQFMLLCISSESKYDSVIRLQSAWFSASEQKGLQIFRQKCEACHREPLFTDHSFRNNGIVPGLNDDKGRYMVTANESDKYKFKVPSLRNIEFTGPYMHDGRFLTLNAVLDHYSSGVQSTPNLDPLLSAGIPLTANEKADVISFLRTLSDRKFLLNPLLSEQ